MPASLATRLLALLPSFVLLAAPVRAELAREDVEAAFRRGVEAMAALPEIPIFDVWPFVQASRARREPRLVAIVEAMRARYADDPRRRLFDPDGPFLELAESPGEGVFRFSESVKASFAQPEDRAIELIREFVARDARGYVLTHQYLTFVWWEEQGRALPADVLAHRPALLRKIAAEHAADSRFGDLYAERVGLLLRDAPPTREVADRWIGVLLEAQSKTGEWEQEGPTPIYLEGGALPAQHTVTHTTGLCLWGLARYLEHYGP